MGSKGVRQPTYSQPLHRFLPELQHLQAHANCQSLPRCLHQVNIE